jgi:hypothetical protein
MKEVSMYQAILSYEGLGSLIYMYAPTQADAEKVATQKAYELLRDSPGKTIEVTVFKQKIVYTHVMDFDVEGPRVN